MNIIDIIEKKRDGGRLSRDEIGFFVKSYSEGSTPDYQASALLMAIYIMGMDSEETFELTQAMRYSGDVINLDDIEGIKMDKHSTGGVGDTTSLVAMPMAASLGIKIAKMSGRGLGFTGGTLDKLESIPGMSVRIPEEMFRAQVRNIGMAIVGQTASIDPADKKMYALRDVTGTVSCIPLIASSIMSKKLAAGSDVIVLDVKTGAGAFMETIPKAEELSRAMCDIGERAGKKVIAIISDMNQPLGLAIGNSVEVIEAIETLKGNGQDDFVELCTTIVGIMACKAGLADGIEEGKALASETIESGRALTKFKEFIIAQGGNPEIIDDYSLLPVSDNCLEIVSESEGYISGLKADVIGEASRLAGAGRLTLEDNVDMSAGILLHKKIGDKISAGESIASVYGCDDRKLEEAVSLCKTAVSISLDEPERPKLIKKIIGL